MTHCRSTPRDVAGRAAPGRGRTGGAALRFVVLLCARDCRCCWCSRRSSWSRSTRSRPRRLRHPGPLSLPQAFYFDGISELLEPGRTSARSSGTASISVVVAVLGVVLSHAQRVRAGHRPGEGPDLVPRASSWSRTCCRRRSLVYPLYYLAKQVGLYDTCSRSIIIFTVIQSAFGTYLLTSVYTEFPTELLDAARDRRRRKLADPVAGRRAGQPARPSACCSRSSSSGPGTSSSCPGPPRLQRQPDRAGRPRRAAGRPPDGRDRRPAPRRCSASCPP